MTGVMDVFGFNKYGELGIPGSTSEHRTPVSTAVTLSPGTAVARVACGPTFTALLLTNGSVAVAGNSDGAVGFRKVARLMNECIVDIAGGATELVCISAQKLWSLPTNAKAPARSFSLPIGEERFVAVSAGALFAIALCKSGRAYALGLNSYGQLGIGTVRTPIVEKLTHIAISEPLVAVSCGGCHALAVSSAGNVYAWGRNNHGQLGLGTLTGDVLTPVKVDLPADITSSVSFAFCGDFHSLLVSVDGELYACGRNSCGQLGLPSPPGSSSDVASFTKVGLSDVADGCANGGHEQSHTIIVQKSGAVFGAGSNEVGQLGLGSSVRRVDAFTKIPVPADHNLRPACGWRHSILLHTSSLPTVSDAAAAVSFRTAVRGASAIPHDVISLIVSFMEPLTALKASLLNSKWNECVRYCAFVWRPQLEQCCPYSLESILTRQRQKHETEDYVEEPNWFLELSAAARERYSCITEYPVAQAPSETKGFGAFFGKFVSSFFSKPDFRILMTGLDAAGKTSLLYGLKLGEVHTTIPTIGFNVEQVETRYGTSFTCWDVGGPDKIRPLWRHYYEGTDAHIFVVDANDRDRTSQALEELHKMRSEELMAGVPCLILLNKMDLPRAMSVEEAAVALDLRSLPQPWCVQGCRCRPQLFGVDAGMQWLSEMCKKRKKAS